MAAPTVFLGIGAYTPCVTNFEGGCGMAKGLAALFSLLPASGAVTLGIFLRAQLAAHPVIVRKAPGTGVMANLLWIAPAFYMLFTLTELF